MEKRRILIVDDDLIMRETLGSYFRQLGYDSIGAPDSFTALALLKSSQFDLVIADLMMPGNEELELIRQLPAIAPGLPVLLLTAHPTLESAVQSVRLPIVAYLVKPPNLDELQTLARQAIDHYRIYQTIAMLAGTRQSFRSRELDELRHKLEELLRHQGDPNQGPGNSRARWG